MALRRIKHQADRSITAFYDSLEDDGWEYISQQMKQLIREIEEDGFADDIWVFTSHSNLCFTLIDDYKEPIIRVGSMHNQHYHIDYSLPPHSMTSTQEPYAKLNLTQEELIAALRSILQTWKVFRNNERGEESHQSG